MEYVNDTKFYKANDGRLRLLLFLSHLFRSCAIAVPVPNNNLIASSHAHTPTHSHSHSHTCPPVPTTSDTPPGLQGPAEQKKKNWTAFSLSSSPPFLFPTDPPTSTLLDLPAVLRTLIRDNAISPHTRIFIFATPIVYNAKSHHNTLGRPRALRYRYHAFVPAILRVCRQRRADGMALYYAKNTFRFDDYMSGERRGFDGFLAVRSGAQLIQRVEVRFAVQFARAHQVRVKRKVEWQSDVINWVVSFVAEGKGGGVRVSAIRARQTGRREVVRAPLEGEEEGLCCCALGEGAARVAGGDGALVEWVGGYVALAKGARESKACEGCRKVQNICAASSVCLLGDEVHLRGW